MWLLVLTPKTGSDNGFCLINCQVLYWRTPAVDMQCITKVKHRGKMCNFHITCLITLVAISVSQKNSSFLHVSVCYDNKQVIFEKSSMSAMWSYQCKAVVCNFDDLWTNSCFSFQGVGEKVSLFPASRRCRILLHWNWHCSKTESSHLEPKYTKLLRAWNILWVLDITW